MRARLVAALVALAGGLLAPGIAQAHPLGNFSVNHVAFVRISDDRVDVRYLLDQAEIPTFQERGRSATSVLATKRAEVRRGLALVVDGRAVQPAFAGPGRIDFLRGQGGLPTTRVELRLSAPVRAARQVRVIDDTFEGRVGWKDIVVAPGTGTAVRSSVPATEPTRELRAYPQSVLSRPSDRRQASFSVRPGSGTVVAPRRDGSGLTATGGHGSDGFAGLLEDAAAGHGVLLLLLLAAFGWGALHALSPGHGKAMVAAYLVGARGTARDALALGATVTITHTIGVFALGLVALSLSAYVLPEDLYPWLNLVAGLMVVVVGAGVLRARVRERNGHVQAHGHSHAHGHGHPHGHGRAHEHGHSHTHGHGHTHEHRHAHTHAHEPPHRDRLSRRGLIALGASAGLIPCPSALVVLLGAIAQHEIALGMVLIAAFSLGLAATLTALGLAVVWTSGLTARLPRSPRVATAVRLIPMVSAFAVLTVGVVLTAQAVPSLV
jgi:nickel/cobalt exporter